MQVSALSPTRSGNRVFISASVVQSALNRLLFSASKQASTLPLEALQIVDRWISNPDLPHFENPREFAVLSILADMISNVCEDILRNHEVSGRLATSQEVLGVVGGLAALGLLEAVGWYWLYCRYVRDHLRITTDAFCAAAHIDPRTLRRLQRRAVKGLTNQLIAAETRVRMERRKQRLNLALPVPPAHDLLEREGLIVAVEQILRKHRYAQILVYGAPGIGKSQFVAEILRRQIAQNQFASIIWINRPSIFDAVVEHISAELLRFDHPLSLQDAVLDHPCAVVIDGCSSLRITQTDLASLTGFTVFLVNDVPLAGVALTMSIEIPALSMDGTQRLLEALTSVDRQTIHSDLHTQTGGNPQAIKQFSYLRAMGLEWNTNQFLTPIFHLLNDDAQVVVSLLLLFSPHPVPLFLLNSILAPSNEMELLRLLQWGWVTLTADKRLALSKPVLDFLRQQTTSDQRYQTVIVKTFEIVVDYVELFLDAAHWAAMALLDDPLIPIDPARQRRWIETYWRVGSNSGLLAYWYAILNAFCDQYRDTAYFADTLLIVRAVLLRRLGKWHEAAGALWRVIADAGRGGEFTLQAWALIELAVLERNRGELSTANELLERARSVSLKSSDARLYQMWHLEVAQVKLAQLEGQAALQYLAQLPQDHYLGLLRAEALMLCGNFEEAIVCASEVLGSFPADISISARLHTVLGRSYQELGDDAPAFQHLSLALMLFEQTNEPFAIARAQANFASAMIKVRQVDEAALLLEQARQTQTHLRDLLGLQFTEHNLDMLRRAWFRG